MTKIGMYGGKFCPIHLGHVYSMIKASTMVDELHVMISYDTEYEKEVIFKDAKLAHIPYKVRLRWWTQLTKDMPHVHVHAVEEKQTGQVSDWQQGADYFQRKLGKTLDVIFSSEEHYGEIFKVLYPKAEHVVLDSRRDQYPISATDIRMEGVMKHWVMIPKVAQPYFVKKVAVVGTESCGKSTLVRNLAALYNTSFVQEYGRFYYERIGDCENVTLPSDYPEIAIEHKYHEYRQLEKANKLLFIDTEAIVTQYFSMVYLNKHQPFLDHLATLQNYDLWLFLEPDVEWIDDGTRSFGEQDIRDINHLTLKKLLNGHGILYENIKGDYRERLETAMMLVDGLLAN